jgi:hypothetical protein
LFNNVNDAYYTVRGRYCIQWSGTTEEQYYVNDIDGGTFEGKVFDETGGIKYFEFKTDSVNEINIELWMYGFYLIGYRVKSDYSFSAALINSQLPCNISGGGRGSWDWQDHWVLFIGSVENSNDAWNSEEWIFFGNSLILFSGGSLIIWVSGIRKDLDEAKSSILDTIAIIGLVLYFIAIIAVPVIFLCIDLFYFQKGIIPRGKILLIKWLPFVAPIVLGISFFIWAWINK